MDITSAASVPTGTNTVVTAPPVRSGLANRIAKLQSLISAVPKGQTVDPHLTERLAKLKARVPVTQNATQVTVPIQNRDRGRNPNPMVAQRRGFAAGGAVTKKSSTISCSPRKKMAMGLKKGGAVSKSKSCGKGY